MTILQRIPRKSVTDFYYDYYHTQQYTHERMGQAFLNRFFPGVSDSDLFHEVEDCEAAKHIEEHYVVLEQAA